MSDKQDFVVNIDGNAKGLDAATLAASRALAQFSKKAGESFKETGEHVFELRSVIASIAGAFTAAAFGEFIKSQVEVISHFKDLSEKIGDSAENIASLKLASDVSGVALDTVAAASIKLTAGLAKTDDEAKGAGIAITKLGLNFDDFVKLSPVSQIEAVANALAGFEDGAGKTAVVLQLFGKSGAELLPFLNELAEKSKRQASLTQDQIIAADEFTKKVARLKSELGLLATVGAGQVIPVLSDTLDILRKTIEDTDKLGDSTDGLLKSGAITEFSQDAVIGLTRVAEALYALVKAGGVVAGSFRAVFADISLLGEFVGRGGLTGLAVESNRKALAAALERRNETVKSANAKLKDLITYDGAQASEALIKGFAEKKAADSKPDEVAAPKPVLSISPTEDPEKVAAAAKKAAEERLKILKATADAATGIYKAEADRAKAALGDQLAHNRIGYVAYYAQQLKANQDAIDSEIATRQKALATADAADRIRLRGEIEALKVQRVTAAEQSARAEADAQKKAADELADLDRQLLEATGHTAEAQHAELERQFSDLVERLKANADDAGVALAQRLFNAKAARIDLTAVQEQIAKVQEDERLGEQRIANERESGLLTERESRRAIIELHQQTADQLEKLIPQYQELAAATGDPAAIQRLQELRLSISELRDTTNAAFKELSDDIGHNFSDSLQGILTQTEGFGSALKGLFRGITASIARQISNDIGGAVAGALKQAAQGSSAGGGLQSLLGSLLGGSGGGVQGVAQIAPLASTSAGPISELAALPVFHQGGVVGAGGQMKKFTGLTFVGAPRYHMGTPYAGLRPDELPAILQRGEVVIGNNDPAHPRNGGSAPTVNVTINTPDPSAFRANVAEIQATIGNAIARAQRRNR